jgi:hypothetical protein
MAICGNHIQRVEIVINVSPFEQVSDLKYVGYLISVYKSDLEDKLQTHNRKKWHHTETFQKTDD